MVLFILLISCSYYDGFSLYVVFLLLVPLFLLYFYLLLASSLHLSGGRLHPPALSVGCLSLLVGRLCLWAVEVYRSSSSVGCVYLTVDEPSLGRFWTVSWQSFDLMAIIRSCVDLRSVSRPCQGRHSVAVWTSLFLVRSLFGRHSADYLFAGCPLVLSLPSDHLSAVSLLYSQSRVSAVLSATHLGCALGHASRPYSWSRVLVVGFGRTFGHTSWL